MSASSLFFVFTLVGVCMSASSPFFALVAVGAEGLVSSSPSASLGLLPRHHITACLLLSQGFCKSNDLKVDRYSRRCSCSVRPMIFFPLLYLLLLQSLASVFFTSSGDNSLRLTDGAASGASSCLLVRVLSLPMVLGLYL